MSDNMLSETQAPVLAQQWEKYEVSFQSGVDYENPLYDVDFTVRFTSPSGKIIRISGFWDGGKSWKVRFMPTELGRWHYHTFCSDVANTALSNQEGDFQCEESTSELPVYQKGAIVRDKDAYHLRHANGAPFLWIACTAWNGTLKATRQEWEHYLRHRAENHFTVIQFVATQWRGCDTDSQLLTAYTGSKKIQINPAYFQHLDEKIDRINAFGLIAAPVLLWALPYGKGRALNPGYHLPQQDAVRLARYMVARYGAHHVVWILGGDGLYTTIHEGRWKSIGQQVFGDPHPGLVAMHPMGKSWIGDTYAEEAWVDIIGYQSGHNKDKSTVEFITEGPAARQWKQLPPKVIINMEPCYEQIHHRIGGDDVRAASCWSLFATPTAGVTYGANGIWPWIRKGEKIMNHGALAFKEPSTWDESLQLPGSRQLSYLSAFLQQFNWYELKPDPDLLAEQPGKQQFDKFISVARTADYHLIMAYVPGSSAVKIYNAGLHAYQVQWFDPKKNRYYPVAEPTSKEDAILTLPLPISSDLILVLRKSKNFPPE